MNFFEFKGVRFAFEDTGKGPALFFLHGFLENSSMWAGIIDGLPQKYRKITLDLPGHGQSGNIGYIHSMEEMAEVVKALFDHLKLKKITLIGHSMGGYVSLAFAELHPDEIRGLVLINSTAAADSEAKKKDRDRAIKLVKQNHKAFVRIAIPNLFRPKNRKSMLEEVRRVKAEALTTTKQGIIAALEGMKIRPDREVLLHFGPYPVLFVAGKHDPVFAFHMLQEQLSAENVVPCITENGHMAHLEDKDSVLKALKGFLTAPLR